MQLIMEIYGLYSPDNGLLSIHRTEIGANKNKEYYETEYGEGFYVDFVTLHE